MMKFLFLLGLSLSACNADTCADADECSMLQVEVTDQTRTQFQMSLAQISEEIAGLELPGAVNRIALDVLSKRLQDERPHSQTTNDSLHNITVILDKVLARLIPFREAEQVRFNDSHDELVRCNDDDSIELAREQNATNLSTIHETCRSTQAINMATWKSDCDQLATQLNDHLQNSRCDKIRDIKPIGVWNQNEQKMVRTQDQFTFATGTDLIQYARWTHGVFIWHQYLNTKWVANHPNCSIAAAAHTLKKSECDGAQATYEVAYCLWRNARRDLCNDRDECFTNKTAEKNNTKNSVKASSDERLKFAAKVKYVKCLINNAKNDEFSDKDCPRFGMLTQSDNDTYGNDVTAADPTKADCHAGGPDPTINYPGSTNWAANHYTDGAWNHTVLRPSAHTCP